MKLKSKYVKSQVVPNFHAWVKSLTEQVDPVDATDLGRKFIKNYIDVKYISSRGEVYECFEELKSYADMAILLQDNASGKTYSNMSTLAQGIINALQHDGFDEVKYNPISMWGMDIQDAK